MREMKLKPIILAFIVVVLLLAGGSFTYRYVAQEKPLQKQLANLDYSHVTMPLEKQNGIYQLTMEIDKDYKLQQAMEELKQVMQQHELKEDSYSVQLQTEGQATGLESVWQEQLFAVAEIMASQQYSKLPELMQHIENNYTNMQADAEMDDQYVYITLLQNGQRFDKLLPLDGGKMEVWQNAQ